MPPMVICFQHLLVTLQNAQRDRVQFAWISNGDLNAMRRAQYQENKGKINAQKRIAYRKRQEQESSSTTGRNRIIVKESTKGESSDKVDSNKLILLLEIHTLCTQSMLIVDSLEQRLVSTQRITN